MKKHWLFTTLVALALCVICFTLFPTEARAASVDDLTFTLNSDGQSYTVLDCTTTADGTLEIPETYNGKPVTSIGSSAFCYCRSLTSVTIPDSVTSIGSYAFSDCDSLTSVTIPNSVISMGENAFQACTKLKSISLSDNLKSIEHYAFYGCKSLTSISIPDSVLSIGQEAFGNCPVLAELSMGNGVTSISASSFSGCYNLKFNIYDNAKYLGNGENPYVVLVGSISDTITTCKIPDETKIIMERAFSNCTSLTTITIPNNVTNIGNYAFASCFRLSSVYLGRKIEKIDAGTFYNCENLNDVYYYGNEIMWNRVYVSFYDNTKFINANLHYLAVRPGMLAGASAYDGEVVVITMSAKGDGLAYTWYYKDPGDEDFKKASSATGSTYKVTMNAERNGRQLYCYVTDMYGNAAKSEVVSITMKKRVAITKQPVSASAYDGEVIPLVVEATGTSLKYAWFYKTKGQTKFTKSAYITGNICKVKMCDAYDGIQFYCQVEDTYENIVKTETVTLTMKRKAAITKQPMTLRIESGAAVKYTVKASGDGLKYQWQSSTDGKTWKNCSSSSATKATFSFTAKTSHSSNYYRCKVTDSAGNTVYTDVARLYVLGITTQPKTQKVEAGEKVKFTVTATGAGKTYQWQYSTNGKTWKNCSSSSATSATFKFTSKTTHNGNYYRCRVKDNAGNTVYTDSVRLYVLGITTQPKTQKVEAGETVKFTVKATGSGLKYQWQSSANGKTWKNCSSTSATKATFTFTSKTSHSSNYYRCRIKDSGGNTVYTDAVRLYVLGITEQPVSKTVTKGKTAKFTVEATGASKVYQWQVSTDGGKTWKNCSSSSAKKATFTFTSKTSHNGNYYRCRIKDSGGNTIYTNKVKLTVK